MLEIIPLCNATLCNLSIGSVHTELQWRATAQVQGTSTRTSYRRKDEICHQSRSNLRFTISFFRLNEIVQQRLD